MQARAAWTIGRADNAIGMADDAVERTLAGDIPALLAPSPHLARGHGLPWPTHTRVGAWLLLEAPLATRPPPLVALERNRRLGGLAKVALVGDGDLRLRAELPTDADGDLARRINDTEVGMTQVLADAAAGSSAPSQSALREPTMLEPDGLAELCTAAGWPSIASHPHKLAVDLGLRGLFARARVEQAVETGVVRVSADFEVVPAPLPETCGEALAVFLLRTAAIVRLVRPFIEYRADRESQRAHAALGFEAVYATPPSPRELGHALAALRVAAEMTSREVGVLARDASIARAYLVRNDTQKPVDPSGPAPTASVTLSKGEE